VECGLISNKYKGFFVKWQEFFGFWNYFSIGKGGGLGPWVGGPRGVAGPRFHSGRRQGLAGAQPNEPLQATAACHEGGNEKGAMRRD
jgi:hypothetical protein